MKLKVQLFIFIYSLILFGCSSNSEQSDQTKGNLIIIGGGKRPDTIIQKFVNLANKAENPKILVLPMASSVPLEVGPEQAEGIRRLGGKNVQVVHFTKEQANQDSILKKFEGVTGIFISGGSQSRFMRVVSGTPVENKIIDLYKNGAVIAGTSAGAAVQSKMMITGDEKLHLSERAPFSRLVSKNIVTQEGLGLISDIIVDQHFVARRRNNRLLSLVIENPQMLGVGIDESTAIWIKPDRTFEVFGDRSVVVYDAGNAQISSTEPESSLLEASDLNLHILKAGAQYDLTSRKVLKLSSIKK